jgi:tetratricopeptide (TPR) repeat protein
LSNQNSFFAKLFGQPVSFSILVLSAVIVVVWLDQREPQTGLQEPALPAKTGMMATDSGTAGEPAALALKGPEINNRNTPGILDSMGAAKSPGKLQAPDLGGLLSGLEAKVAAEPGNISKRLLLAQTYNELGMADKALVELREMRKADPSHSRVNLVLASILSHSEDADSIKESLGILDSLAEDKSVKQYLVQMYRGDALIRSSDHKGALEQWSAALKTMPEADNRRSDLEQRINDLGEGGVAMDSKSRIFR